LGRRLWAAYDLLVAGLAWIAGACVVALVALPAIDFVIRISGTRPISWIFDLSAYLLMLFTFLTAPWLLKCGNHVAVDILVANVSIRLRLILLCAANVLGLGACLGLIYAGWMATSDSFLAGSLIIKELIFPEWWVQSVIPTTALILVPGFAREIWRLLTANRDVEVKRATAATF
jgi:TRAP-type C4-dicarboxylate transport system permease small subunit